MTSSPRTSDLDEIATFIRVVRNGSLAGAARELDVPKSTVSRRVTRLEKRLNVALLHRSARQVLVTPEGKRLYDRVAGSVDAIELAVSGTLQDADLPRGNIRMTAPADFGRLVLLEELVSFAEAFPEITVDLDFTDRFVDLAAEGFDLAIRAGRSPDQRSDDSLITRRLMTMSLQLGATEELAARVSCLEDLARVPFILFRTRGPHQLLRLRNQSGVSCEVRVEGRFVVHDYTSLAELVARGVGMALMPSIHIDNASKSVGLIRVLPDLFAEAGHIALVYPSRRLPARVKLLIDHLQQRVAVVGDQQ